MDVYLLMLQKHINSKQKKYEVKYYVLYLDNIGKDFTNNNLEKTELEGVLILLILTVFYISINI